VFRLFFVRGFESATARVGCRDILQFVNAAVKVVTTPWVVANEL
jgi:hypothetical protein